MTEGAVLDHLKQVGALVQGSHLVYTSGRHGKDYVNKDALYPHTQITAQLAEAMAKHFAERDIEVVVGPVMGGVILAQWVAFFLSKMEKRDVLAVFAEKSEGGFSFQRGYESLVRGRHCLIVEDILTTGGSVKKVVELVQKTEAKVGGIVALCNRGNVKSADVGDIVDPIALIALQLESWEAKDCPMCKTGVPVNTQIGKGAEFVNKT